MKLENYSKINNNYCIAYFGYSDEYLVQLRLIYPLLKSNFPDLNIVFSCRKEKTHLFKNCCSVISYESLLDQRNNFGNIYELKYNGKSHPVLDLLENAEITDMSIKTPTAVDSDKCVILTTGNFPTKNLTNDQIEKAKSYAKNMSIFIDENIHYSGLVIGAESVDLFEAAAQGIKTILIPTGVGSKLFKKMFPTSQVA